MRTAARNLLKRVLPSDKPHATVMYEEKLRSGLTREKRRRLTGTETLTGSSSPSPLSCVS
jgi:hypothetical protein